MLYIFSKSFAVYLYVNFPSVSTLKILTGFYCYRVSSLGVLKMIFLKILINIFVYIITVLIML